MWNIPTKSQLDQIPRLYETEHIPTQDKLIYLHFFIGGSDWYVAEHDGDDIFWGYVVFNGDHSFRVEYSGMMWTFINCGVCRQGKEGVGGFFTMVKDVDDA